MSMSLTVLPRHPLSLCPETSCDFKIIHSMLTMFRLQHQCLWFSKCHWQIWHGLQCAGNGTNTDQGKYWLTLQMVWRSNWWRSGRTSGASSPLGMTQRKVTDLSFRSFSQESLEYPMAQLYHTSSFSQPLWVTFNYCKPFGAVLKLSSLDDNILISIWNYPIISPGS